MNILLVTYFYGHTASGVISKRVAEQLSKAGNRVVVLTQNSIELEKSVNTIRVVEVKNSLRRNRLFARIIRKVEESTKLYYYDWLWVKKAVRKSKCIIKSFHPDIIYCRSTPVNACYVGYILNKKYSIPVLQHFSDPVPAPIEYLLNSRKRELIIKKIRRIIQSATMVSYGNEYMLSYVQKEIGFSFSHKAFISPDMSSGDTIHFYPQTSAKKARLTYFGNIYGGRNPQPLYDAISQLNLQNNNIELLVYSNLDPEVLNRYPFVKSMGYDNDTFRVLAEANVLVDLDGDDEEPVFISSKLKDYLLINRPILSITPEKSPSANLLKNMKTVDVVRNDVEEIKQSIMRLLNKTTDDCEYNERMDLIRYFGPSHVASTIVEHIAAFQRCDDM